MSPKLVQELRSNPRRALLLLLRLREALLTQKLKQGPWKLSFAGIVVKLALGICRNTLRRSAEN